MQSDSWHYVRGEQQFGPVPFEVLQTLAQSGDLGQEDLVWTESMPSWIEAGTVNGLFAPGGSVGPVGGVRRKSSRRKSRGGSARRGGARRSGGGMPAAPTFGARTSPLDEDPRERAERVMMAKASKMPGMVIFAAVLDVMGAGLAAVVAVITTAAAGIMRAATSEELVEMDPAYADPEHAQRMMDYIALLGGLTWAVMAGFLFCAVFVLTGVAASRVVQVILSCVMAIVPALSIAQNPLNLFSWFLVCLALAPAGCLAGKDVTMWHRYKAGKLGGGGVASRGGRRGRAF